MAANSDGASNKSWLKLAVVPLLMGVLGFVLWSNLTPAAVDSSTTLQTTLAPSTPNSIVSKVKASTAKPKRVTWPKFSHEQILATNPFRASSTMQAALKPLAESSPGEIAAAKKMTLEEEMEEEAHDPWAGLIEAFPGNSQGVYIESSKGPALKIGVRLLHVGDRIGDRYRITGIRPDGIVVEAEPALK